jgi:uncharacterized protein (TIGR02757 family)
MSQANMRNRLEELYRKYNRREFVHPDPVEFLYRYEDLRDREIAAFVASSLAYGRVTQIHKSVSRALERMIPSPSVFLQEAPKEEIHRTFADYKHRVTTGQKFSCMLFGLKQIIKRYGSLQACFLAGLDNHDTALPALATFTTELTTRANDKLCHLVPCPTNGSACKRLNLFLRWIVRHDKVDPGGWDGVSAAKLIVPVDIHMHRVCLSLRLTKRKQADMRTAMEITEAFRQIVPEDPVRYDFVLTRLAIQGEADLIAFLRGSAAKYVIQRPKASMTAS